MAMRQRQVKDICALDQPNMEGLMITDFNEVSNRILSLCVILHMTIQEYFELPKCRMLFMLVKLSKERHG